MATFRFDLLPDKRRARFRINEHPDIDYRFDAAGIDALIARLGNLRAKMEPSHKENKLPRPPGSDYAGLEGTSMAVSHIGPTIILHINDIRYGWLHYFMTRERAGTLADHLKIEAARIAPPQAFTKPN